MSVDSTARELEYPQEGIGFTTGTAAAAATKIAAKLLLYGERSDREIIHTPSGHEFSIESVMSKRTSRGAVAMVRKMAGSDPDVTDQMLIGSFVTLSDKFALMPGYGIGIATKPGLAVLPGEAAINPGPRAQIKKVIEEVLADAQHEQGSTIGAENFNVRIFAPAGKTIAARTMNGKLGIEGGISIIGTTGVVRPMSVEAYIGSLKTAVSVAVATNFGRITLVPGNIGENAFRHHTGDLYQGIVQFANYPIELLAHAVALGADEVLFFGHIGKLVKLANGARRTGYTDSGMACDALCSWLQRSANLGIIKDANYVLGVLPTLQRMNTAEQICHFLLAADEGRTILNTLAEQCSITAHKSVVEMSPGLDLSQGLTIGTVLTDLAGNIVGMDANAEVHMRSLHNREDSKDVMSKKERS